MGFHWQLRDGKHVPIVTEFMLHLDTLVCHVQSYVIYVVCSDFCCVELLSLGFKGSEFSKLPHKIFIYKVPNSSR